MKDKAKEIIRKNKAAVCYKLKNFDKTKLQNK